VRPRWRVHQARPFCSPAVNAGQVLEDVTRVHKGHREGVGRMLPIEARSTGTSVLSWKVQVLIRRVGPVRLVIECLC